MDDRVEPVRDYYNRRAESEWHRLAAPFDGELEWQIHQRAIAELLQPGDRVLDLGGGPGRWSIWMARRGHRVVLADLSSVQLAIADREARAAGVELEAIVEVDARDLRAFPDGAFDAVLALGPLYHLTDEDHRQSALGEIARVLKPGGRLAASVMTRFPWAISMLFDRKDPDAAAAAGLLATGTLRQRGAGEFTEAFLFDAHAVEPFFNAAGFTTDRVLASQGFLGGQLERLAELRERDQRAWEDAVELAWQAAGDRSVHGLSSYLLWTGHRSEPLSNS